MPERTHLISSIRFQPNGDVIVDYMVPRDDAKDNGLLLNHALYVPYGEDYDQEIDAVYDTALELLLDALEDHHNLPPLDLSPPDRSTDDDDDEDDD